MVSFTNTRWLYVLYVGEHDKETNSLGEFYTHTFYVSKNYTPTKSFFFFCELKINH